MRMFIIIMRVDGFKVEVRTSAVGRVGAAERAVRIAGAGADAVLWVQEAGR